jgi:hypothetical protein
MSTSMNEVEQAIQQLLSGNEIYTDNYEFWRYLLESYLGGKDYQDAGHLTRYQLETESEYTSRLLSTPLDNQCQSVISVYNSFLFREQPQRDFGSIGDTPELESFLKDADMDGRNFNSFMKDVSTWSSVFGHSWIIMAKPDIGALTRADEIAAGVRPYVSLITPLAVLDWNWYRRPSGKYELDYLRYIEDINGDIRVVKEWTLTEIRTYRIDAKAETMDVPLIETNGLGIIPAIIAYNGRSIVRGIGISDIADIADGQKFLYNLTSEVEQSVRLDSHPSLVKTPETQAGTGAGSLIHMPENLDPGLKPYLLEYSGANINSILAAMTHIIDSIDKMANTGAVRATEARTASGVAMETEFQLLNARLAEKADQMELAEESLWRLWCLYQDQVYDIEVEYPGSFNIRDTSNEFKQLQMAKTTATDPAVLQVIDEKLVEALGEEPEEVFEYTEGLPAAYVPATDPRVPEGQNCANCEYYNEFTSGCSKWDETVSPVFWCAGWDEKEPE